MTPRAGSVALLLMLLSAAVGLQAVREQRAPLPGRAAADVLYVRSAPVLERLALSYRTLLADIYWLRAVQHYGRTKLSAETDKRYDLLYPLLDLTTSLDPRFNVAYRFGAIFLAEPFPGGPGRPDLAIELLRKGLRSQPNRWELAEDIGFVYYWWLNDHERAAEWFTRASRLPGAPDWLGPVAATTLAEGGSRASSRRLWQEIAGTAEAEWLRATAALRLRQLDALDQLDGLLRAAQAYEARTGAPPSDWRALVAARLLPGLPVDSAGFPVQLMNGRIGLHPQSPLGPLPTERKRTP